VSFVLLLVAARIYYFRLYEQAHKFLQRRLSAAAALRARGSAAASAASAAASGAAAVHMGIAYVGVPLQPAAFAQRPPPVPVVVAQAETLLDRRQQPQQEGETGDCEINVDQPGAADDSALARPASGRQQSTGKCELALAPPAYAVSFPVIAVEADAEARWKAQVE